MKLVDTKVPTLTIIKVGIHLLAAAVEIFSSQFARLERKIYKSSLVH